MWLGSASNYRIINIFIFKNLVFTHVHEFFFFYIYILQVWQGLLKFSENYLNLDLQITPFFSKINILNYVVLLCIEFVILLIEEKVMSYVTVSKGHAYPLVTYIKRRRGPFSWSFPSIVNPSFIFRKAFHSSVSSSIHGWHHIIILYNVKAEKLL
jgi:hypothetical protein